MSETKREDHPLWNEYVEWCKVDARCSCERCNLTLWPAFLAGAEAMAEYLPKKVAAAHVTPRCKVLADRLANAVERLEILSHRQESQIGDQVGDQARLLNILLRLEELGKKHDSVVADQVGDQTRAVKVMLRLEGAADRLTTLNNFCEGMAALLVQLEALCQRHEKMGLVVTWTEDMSTSEGGKPTG